MAKWDWAASTVDGHSAEEVAGAVLGGFELADLAPGKPMYGYENSAQVVRGGRVLALILWGGNPGVHVIGTGENAPHVWEALKPFPHRPSRVDACEDWVEAGLFERLSGQLIGYAVGHRIKIDQRGDWITGQGRTLYLGAPSSPVRLRLYEKGWKEGADPNWVRLEVEIRPQGDARAKVACWVPGDAFGASQWLVGALRAIGWGHLEKRAVGTVRKRTDSERARFHMLRQYGATLESWADELGSWEALAACLSDVLSRSAPLLDTLQNEPELLAGKAGNGAGRT